jgi:ubiquinone/menaquinone biosynthesis C-methylase UbiE
MKPYEYLSKAYHDNWGNRMINAYIPIIEYAVKKYDIKNKNVLDFSCGTGNLLGALSKMGFICKGSDLSGDMIAIAKQHYQNIPFFVEDMSSIRMRQEFDVILNTFNSVNYLLLKSDVIRMFRSVRRIIAKDGVYVLDFSTANMYEKNFEGKYRHDYSGMIFEQVCEYDREERIARTTFIYEDGQQEIHEQKAYSLKEILEMIDETGFEILDSFGNFDMSPQDEESLRYVFILRSKSRL